MAVDHIWVVLFMIGTSIEPGGGAAVHGPHVNLPYPRYAWKLIRQQNIYFASCDVLFETQVSLNQCPICPQLALRKSMRASLKFCCLISRS